MMTSIIEISLTYTLAIWLASATTCTPTVAAVIEQEADRGKRGWTT